MSTPRRFRVNENITRARRAVAQGGDAYPVPIAEQAANALYYPVAVPIEEVLRDAGGVPVRDAAGNVQYRRGIEHRNYDLGQAAQFSQIETVGMLGKMVSYFERPTRADMRDLAIGVDFHNGLPAKLKTVVNGIEKEHRDFTKMMLKKSNPDAYNKEIFDIKHRKSQIIIDSIAPMFNEFVTNGVGFGEAEILTEKELKKKLSSLDDEIKAMF